jgi:hypothetical protein
MSYQKGKDVAVSFRRMSQNDISSVSSFTGIAARDYEHEFFSQHNSRSILIGAVADGQIVGLEGYISYDVIARGEKALTHRSERTIVDPALRGRDVFRKMVNECSAIAAGQGSLFCWGSTPVLKAFKAAGFNVFSGYRAYAAIAVHPKRLMSSDYWRGLLGSHGFIGFLKKLKKKDLHALKEIMGLIACIRNPFGFKAPINDPSVEHLPFPRCYQDIDALHLKIPNGDSQIFLSHTQELFEWVQLRQRQHGHELKMIATYQQGELVSYLLILLRQGSNIADVVDFCFTDLYYFNLSWAHMTEQLAEKGVAAAFIAFNERNAFQNRMLDKLKPGIGIIKSGLGSWVVRPIESDQLTDDLSNWYLTDLWCLL